MASVPIQDEFDCFDFGAHLLPESVIPESFSQFDAYVGAKHSDADEYVKWMAKGGVDGAALSQPYFMGHDDEEEVATANDALLNEIAGHPSLVGLAAIPTAAGGHPAAHEFDRSLEKGYHGGALETKSGGVELHDRAVEPILEVADETGAPLLVHPKLDESLHPDVLDDTYRLNAIFGREVALMESICNVIHDGVLDRFPNLTLVFHHFGGNIAAMMGRIHLQLDDGRWPNQDRVKSFREFKHQLERRVFVDTSGFFGYEAPLRLALEELAATQIVFGTDAPYEPRTTAELDSFVRTVTDSASEADASRILSENASELLDL